MSKIQFSPVESARFGYRIFRAGADISPDVLLDNKEAPDIIIIRDADAKIHELYERLRVYGDVHFRDTILQYRKRLMRETLIQPMGVECEIRPIVPEDQPFLQVLTSEVFRDYPGHYQRSAFFSQSDSAAGMYDWLKNLAGKPENKAFTVFYDGNPVGVLAYEIRGLICELALAAIHPCVGLSKRNLVMLESVRLAELRFQKTGMTFFMAKTQASNLSVQKDLVRTVRCEPMQSLSTLHLHCFLHQLAERGVRVPLFGDFTQTVLNQICFVCGNYQIAAMTVFVRPDCNIDHVKVVVVRRIDDGRDAFFFAGISKENTNVAHAAVYLR